MTPFARCGLENRRALTARPNGTWAEASHHTFQVADFVLSWRGYPDEVLRGYPEVRPLSELEREMIVRSTGRGCCPVSGSGWPAAGHST